MQISDCRKGRTRWKRLYLQQCLTEKGKGFHSLPAVKKRRIGKMACGSGQVFSPFLTVKYTVYYICIFYNTLNDNLL